MNYRSLGNSGLKVSELSLGSWTTFGGSVGEADAASIVRKGRLQPGRMFLVDTDRGRIVDDAEIKSELAAEAPYDAHTQGVAVPSSHDPAVYLERLAALGCEVDAWETTYVHILQGEDPVLEWYKGTGLRPVLAALDAERAGDFLAEYGTELRLAYPPRSFGTIFPFRRVFAVAHRPG